MCLVSSIYPCGLGLYDVSDKEINSWFLGFGGRGVGDYLNVCAGESMHMGIIVYSVSHS